MNKLSKIKLDINKVLILVIAFMVGAALYFVGAIAYDKLSPSASAASGAWHQIVVKTGVCDCITKFEPSPALPGSGTSSDPYVISNTSFGMLVSVNGQGHITIEDEDGNILAEYDQALSDNPERIVPISFSAAGGHRLIAKVNGSETSAVGVSTDIYLQIGTLPPIVPDIPLPWQPWLPNVPNTGYIYIAGYAVQIYSLIVSGIIGAVMAWFVMAAYRRRQQQNRTAIRVYARRTTTRPTARRSSTRSTSRKR